MSHITNQNTEPLFIFDMPDDEVLSQTISVQGEKGERGDPTKTSQLINDSDYTTNAALAAGLATKADADDVAELAPIVAANESSIAGILARTIEQKGYAPDGYKYAKVTTLPQKNDWHYGATIAIKGRMGGYEAVNIEHIDIVVGNRNGNPIAFGDRHYNTGYGTSHVDIVAYEESNGSVGVYLRTTGYYAYCLDLTFQDCASEYDGEFTTVEPSGTLVWQLTNDDNVLVFNNGVLAANISGDSATTNGHTINADVPSNAVFTDTIYDDTVLAAAVNEKANTADVASTYATIADVARQEAELATQTARIDALSTLDDGSTTGDAELQDIRVGYDGNTYANAGASVRTQASKIADDLYAGKNLTFVQGSIKVDTGANNTHNYRIRSDFIGKDDNIVKMRVDAGYRYGLFVYDATKTYLGMWNGTELITDTATFLNEPKTVYLRQWLDLGYFVRITLAHDVLTERIYPADGSHATFYTSSIKSNESKIDDLADNLIGDISVDFEQSSIDAATGELTSGRSDRIRTKNYLPKGAMQLIIADGYRAMIYAWQQDGTYVGVWQGSSFAQTATFLTGTLDLAEISQDDTYKLKVVGAINAAGAAITPSEGSKFSFTGKRVDFVEEKVDDLSQKVDNFIAGDITTIPVQTSCIVEQSIGLTQGTNTGCCIVPHNGTYQLWAFTTGSDDGSTSGWCYKYSYDAENGTLTELGRISHNLGHVNSVAYCEATDTLICGNGSGDYTLEGAIYILEGAYAKTELTRSDCIIVPFTEYGTKVNCVWGDSNFGANDIAYVLTNDSHDIIKLQLGKGANNLGSGSYISDAAGFNGTYKVLGQWSWGTLKREYDVCVQGATFCSNKLVWGYGHNIGKVAVHYAKLIENGKAQFGGINYEQYGATGEQSENYPCGVSTYKDKLIVTSSQVMHRVDLNASL